MLRKVFTIFLLFCYTLLQAQSPNEKLEKLYKDVAISQIKGNNIESSVKEIKSILKIQSLTSEERLKGLLVLANLYKLKGNNTLSLEIAEEARVFAAKKKMYLWQARLLGFMSSIYRISEMTVLSEEKLQQALEVAKKAPENDELKRFYTNAYHEMAYYATSHNEYEQALSYLQLSTSWVKKQNNNRSKFSIASNYQFSGTLFNRLNEPDSAIFYFKNSLRLLGKPTDLNTKTLENYVYTNMGYSYMLKNDFETTRKLLTKVLKDSLQFRTTDLNQDLYGNWVQYYQNRGDIDSMKMFKHKLDSINGLIFKSNTDAVNNVTKKLHSENKLLPESNDAIYWSISGIVFILGVVFLRNLKIEKRKVKQFNKPDAPLESLIVKDVRVEELHIAKETEQRLVGLIKNFEENKEYLNADISQTMLANQFNTNTKYITHVLRKMYDKDFNAYINELKINYVVDLLKEDPKFRQYKISYLAEVAGYSSHSKFASVFKKIKGCSPSEFIAGLED